MATERQRSDNASELLLDAVGGLESGQEIDIDAMCVRHFAIADELRRVYQEWCSAREALAVPNTLLLARHRTQGTWKAFLETLRSRAPSHRRYTFQEKIAAGGQGQVNRVFDEDLDRPLAMKVMHAHARSCTEEDTWTVDDSSIGRFLEEARITGRLDHPGIAPVHELGVDDLGRIFFTMKLVKGVNFDVVIREARAERDGWNRTRALSVVLRACEAVAYAHSRNVIHRDLKPSNIMVGRFGETYVMDWGLARILGDDGLVEPNVDREPRSTVLRSVREVADRESPDFAIETLEGAIVGTPSFMAPEQAAGKTEEVGPGSDIYAAGAILYQLLTGHAPYLAAGAKIPPRTILGLVIHGPPTPVRELEHDVPAELEAIVSKAMAREIGDRYSSMLDLTEDLRAFLDHRVVRAHRTGAVVELVKWTRRNRLAAALALGLMMAVVGQMLVWHGIDRPSDVVVTWEQVDEVRKQGHGTSSDPSSEQAGEDRILTSDAGVGCESCESMRVVARLLEIGLLQLTAAIGDSTSQSDRGHHRLERERTSLRPAPPPK